MTSERKAAISHPPPPWSFHSSDTAYRLQGVRLLPSPQADPGGGDRERFRDAHRATRGEFAVTDVKWKVSVQI